MSGAGIGVYLFAVVWHKNTVQLGRYLKKEEGYIEFIVALLILGAINKYAPSSKIAKTLTAFAILAALISIAEKNNLSAKLGEFASGRVSGLDTLKDIFKRDSSNIISISKYLKG